MESAVGKHSPGMKVLRRRGNGRICTWIGWKSCNRDGDGLVAGGVMRWKKGCGNLVREGTVIILTREAVGGCNPFR